MMKAPGDWRLGHRPALDGLRGVAIALVVADHAELLPQPAGGIGVSVFFALSGFLITCLLLEERNRTGGTSLTAFYARRARRLFPALGVYLTVSMLLTLVGVSLYAFPVNEYLGPLLYVQNWLMAMRGAAPHVTSITWSLAIEEQFYLVWPLAVIVASRWGWRGPAVVAAVGTVLAPVLRLALWDDGAGQWRIYYGTDTRMDCLFIGCLLAVGAHTFGVPALSRRWCLVGGLLIAAPFWGGDRVHLWLPAAVAVGTCVVIGVSLDGRSPALGSVPLRWLGRRSYALYLWHYPLVFGFARELGMIPMAVALALSLLLAEASWWFVEKPFMRRKGGGEVARGTPFRERTGARA